MDRPYPASHGYTSPSNYGPPPAHNQLYNQAQYPSGHARRPLPDERASQRSSQKMWPRESPPAEDYSDRMFRRPLGFVCLLTGVFGICILWTLALVARSWHFQVMVLPTTDLLEIDMSLWTVMVASNCKVGREMCKRVVDALDGAELGEAAELVCTGQMILSPWDWGCSDILRMWKAGSALRLTIILTIISLMIGFLCALFFYFCRPLVKMRQVVISVLFFGIVFSTMGFMIYTFLGKSLPARYIGILPLRNEASVGYDFSFSSGFFLGLFALIVTWTIPCWFIKLMPKRFCTDYAKLGSFFTDSERSSSTSSDSF